MRNIAFCFPEKMDNVTTIEKLVNKIGYVKTDEVVSILHASQFAIHHFLSEDADINTILNFLKQNITKCEDLINNKSTIESEKTEPSEMPIHNIWDFMAKERNISVN